jgi:hypothetical protein
VPVIAPEKRIGVPPEIVALTMVTPPDGINACILWLGEPITAATDQQHQQADRQNSLAKPVHKHTYQSLFIKYNKGFANEHERHCDKYLKAHKAYSPVPRNNPISDFPDDRVTCFSGSIVLTGDSGNPQTPKHKVSSLGFMLRCPFTSRYHIGFGQKARNTSAKGGSA